MNNEDVRRAIDLADGALAASGGRVSDEDRELARRMLRGEITIDATIGHILAEEGIGVGKDSRSA